MRSELMLISLHLPSPCTRWVLPVVATDQHSAGHCFFWKVTVQDTVRTQQYSTVTVATLARSRPHGSRFFMCVCMYAGGMHVPGHWPHCPRLAASCIACVRTCLHDCGGRAGDRAAAGHVPATFGPSMILGHGVHGPPAALKIHNSIST